MSILKKLYDERVFESTVSEDGKYVTIEECCDYYYRVDLSKSELLQLIEELKVIAGEMSE